MIRRTAAVFLALLALAAPAPAQSPAGSPPLVPDPKLTPGATLPVTVADIAVPGYTKKVRNVPASVKRQVYAEYGIASHAPGEYEVDHLISLELGGSNSVKNLWPESYVTQPWNAHVKDRLENKLHALVVSGQLTLPEAQREIATDWIGYYKKYFGSALPVTKSHAFGLTKSHSFRQTQDVIVPVPTARAKRRHARAASSAHGAGSSAQVWVNLNTGVYHYPGERWYGNTANGQYMSEDAAKKAGYRATENGQ